ncbi:hypothetical protein VKT23_012830 [Stygiomarasmius scandens]|uniref:Uncharacterized protein n=1 Tax=Marasmiellus scandens TaxID=2682957 RepID=A0ABR1J7U5_9AGAR
MSSATPYGLNILPTQSEWRAESDWRTALVTLDPTETTPFLCSLADDIQVHHIVIFTSIKERELQSMFSFSQGPVILKIPNKEYTSYDGPANAGAGSSAVRDASNFNYSGSKSSLMVAEMGRCILVSSTGSTAGNNHLNNGMQAGGAPVSTCLPENKSLVSQSSEPEK